MKTIEKMIEAVFERKSAYEAHKKAQRTRITKALSITLCLTLLLGVIIGGGAMLTNPNVSESYSILLDINPSIVLSVDESNSVKSAEGLNSDGKGIVDGMKLNGEAAPDALKTVISEVVDQGYISEEANSVLVSIEGADGDKGNAIKEEIADSVNEALSEKSIDGSIIVQVIPPESDGLDQEAEAHGISAGKVQLINRILEHNKLLTFDELAKMSIHELDLLRVSYYVDMENSYDSGKPADIKYIGTERAEEIALGDANVSVTERDVKFECYNCTMIYRVEFETETKQYRYRINAVTGEIITAENVDFGKDNFHVGEKEIATVGENAAILAALSHAGLENSTLIRCKYNSDWVDGKVIYNIFFTDGIISGRYVVNARTGDIIQHSITKEYHDRSVKSAVIGNFEAKRIALAKDGLIDGKVSKYEMNLQTDGEEYVYVLSFICNATRYNVQIDAESGTVLSFEKTVLKDTGAPSVETEASVSAEK